MELAAGVGLQGPPETVTLLHDASQGEARALAAQLFKEQRGIRMRGARAGVLLAVGFAAAALVGVAISRGAGHGGWGLGLAQQKLEVKTERHEVSESESEDMSEEDVEEAEEEEKDEEEEEEEEEPKKPKVCSPQWKNCQDTKCCKEPGTRCYEKDSVWAMCRPTCVPGPNPTDPNNKTWSCKALGPQKPGLFKGELGTTAKWVQGQCAGPGQSCAKSRCCKQPGMQCFRKDKSWASCKPSCTQGSDPTDPNETDHYWDCKALGEKTPGNPDWSGFKAAKWVSKNCSGATDNCLDAGCCKGPGLQCYKKNDKWAQCLISCHPGPRVTDPSPHDWNCTAIGARTPGHIPAIGNIWEKVDKHEWVKERCAESPKKGNNWTGDNCMKSKCCKDDGTQCYSMDHTYGQCLKSCSSYVRLGPNAPLKNLQGEPWECKKYGQRHPHKWGSPSLFCFSVFQLYTYEGDIIKNQLSKGIGIFACEEFSVMSQDSEVTVGDGPDGLMWTSHFNFVPVGVSEDGTAGNTGLFMNVWESVRWGGKYKLCDWTVKADPDAVLLPDRMRQHVVNVPQGGYLQNCPIYPASPLYGAIEAVSRKALDNYFNNENPCRSMPWGSWGEDKWLTRCLASVGGQPRMDTGEVGDARCLGQNCGDGKPAYHPLKDVAAWMNCWYQAGR